MNLAAELSAHLFRLKLWAILSLLVGGAVLWGDRRSGFGGMTVGWAVVNLAIAFAAGRGDPGAYEGFRRFLTFNLGLNLLWIGGGLIMMRTKSNAWVTSAGLAMAIQGSALMLLDGLLWFRTGHSPGR